jgi:hypothetical protein
MELFIPLVIFWVVSSVIRGLQKAQAPQRGGPLPRPQSREDRPAQAEPVPERPVRRRRQSMQPEESAPPVVMQAETRASEKRPRQSRLMKEGEVARPVSRLWDTPSADAAPGSTLGSAQDQQTGLGSLEIASARQAAVKVAGLSATIKQDLRRPQSLKAAILYGEILGEPRCRRPHRPPLYDS